MRPQAYLHGFPSQKFEEVVGASALSDIPKNSPIKESHIFPVKKKICVVVASRANYGRVKYVMKAIKSRPDLELQLIVGASALLYRFGSVVDVIKADGFIPNKELYYIVEGENLITQAKTTGLGIIELATAFEDLKPDAVISIADRFETMCTAVAASYMNIPLVHIQGGEVTGNIDDKVRNAISKMADYHFPATHESSQRLIRMGEDMSRVFNFGCPAMDVLKNEDLSINNEKMSKYGGLGNVINWSSPYILMIQHPVTSEFGHGYEQVRETLEALLEFENYQKIVLWPNIDAGSEHVAKSIRVFREVNREKKFHYFRNFSPEDFARVLNNASCCVGNSSSFIREGSFLGVPAVIVGKRQHNRESGANVIFCDYEKEDLVSSIKKQLVHGRYKSEHIFGSGDTGRKIAAKLAEIELSLK
jgi:UDP-hydrolysing UDP-N-acetyl-D-glucosamine 2-epimerase